MKLLEIGTGQNNTLSSWLLNISFLWLFSVNCAKANAGWAAYMNTSFHVGNRVLSVLGETEVFGRSFTLKRVTGVLVPPDGRTKNACNPNTTFSRSANSETWLALIEWGGCNFTQKIRVATEKGARGVIIYNLPGSGKQVFPMSHQPFQDIVVVMISNLKGMEILRLIQKGVPVTVTVEVGRKDIIWMNRYFLCFMVFSTAMLTYFAFYYILALWFTRNQNRRWQQLATNLKIVFGQLQVRVLKEGDEELNPSGDSCIICFEPYKPNDTIRILICKHIFHKNCIDPWILSHGTCPVCKFDIFKAFGIQVNSEYKIESLQVLMANELPEILSPVEEATNNEVTPARIPDAEEHITSLDSDRKPNSIEEIAYPSP
ncbi:E3 ubiquitin-protein ligase RNF133 [Cavia porcellus]|uniref:E3 ubiquitin-protein ligase RNF133 n=1 Tax=Cavia porcellus TaxID=10141 RepID=UPI000184F5B6|nr:E3 ubiquitin-protein ligase RNF133 [Cavia porcellus]